MLPNYTQELLQELSGEELTQRDIAHIYARAMLSIEKVNWYMINDAIADRWGEAALDHIKKLAWRKLPYDRIG